MPPQKAYNLRGVVSRKQDLEISRTLNLEQNPATFLSAGMAPGYIWAFGLHASQRVRSNCAEYLFKSNIKNIIVSVELYCAVLLPQIKIQTTSNVFPQAGYSVLWTSKLPKIILPHQLPSELTLIIVAPAWGSGFSGLFLSKQLHEWHDNYCGGL